MPKQIICAFLPDSVGTQRPPGRLKGKWYRQTLVEAMRVADIPITIWTQFANRNNGDDRRLVTRKVALWYKPMYPRQHADAPNFLRNARHIRTKVLQLRYAERMTGLRPKSLLRRGFSGLRMTMHQYHCTPLFEPEARAQFGGDWFLEDFDDVFTRVMDTPFWEPALLRLIGL